MTGFYCHCEDTYRNVGATSAWTNEVDHVGNVWPRKRREQVFDAYMDVGATNSWTNEVDHVGNVWSRKRREQVFDAYMDVGARKRREQIFERSAAAISNSKSARI